MIQKAGSITTADILRDILAAKMNRNSAFSLRALARDLGVSHTYLSLVMNGKKSLSLKKVIQFSETLELSEPDAHSFIRAASRESRGKAYEQSKSTVSKARIERQLQEYYEIESDRFRVLNEWYHLPILDLTLTTDFKSDPKWIAMRLSLSVEQVTNAIERLKRLKLLHEENGKLIKSSDHIVFLPKKPDESVRSYHRQMIGKAATALSFADKKDVAARDITAVTIPIDPARIPEARKRIQKFRRSLWKYLSEGETTELYQFNLQLFPLSTRKSTKTTVRK